MELNPPSILRGWVPFQSEGLGPLLLYGAGSPFNEWGWIPLKSTGGRIFQILGSLEHLSAFYGAQHVWFCRIADSNLRGWVPYYCVGLDPPFILRGCVPFQSVGLGPLSSNWAGSPSTLWGWVPFYSMGLGPLLLCGGPPFTQWGWVPFYSVGLGPLSFCGTEYHI